MTTIRTPSPSPTTPSAVVNYLLDPHHHPDRPQQTELIETHISWVVLTDRFVYKVKKPVQFSFVDFSTLEKRKQACLEEVRLNRRLAQDIYLDVVPIVRRATHELAIGGTGTIVDWVVKMRRLPESQSLVKRLQSASVSHRELDNLGDYLTRFYSQQPPLMLRPEPTRQQIADHIRSNQSDLATQLPTHIQVINRIHAALLRYVATNSGLFDSRICDGRFIEGHGDLRPEHIYLTQPPAVIDCVEFSQELRQVDIADELCFLWMECEHLGHGPVGAQLWQIYSRVAGDLPPTSLLNFYKAYRACVRAKVCALQAAQADTARRKHLHSETENYLSAADRYQSNLGRGLVILMTGLMGSGKSTLASALADLLGAHLIQTDQERRRLFGASPIDANYGDGHYQDANRDLVYQHITQRVDQLLEDAATVIVDGTFAKSDHRLAIRSIAEKRDADCVIFRCTCPRAVALDRIAHRRSTGSSLSEARTDLYDQQARDWQPDPLELPAQVIDSQASLSTQMQQVMNQLALLGTPSSVC